MTRVEALLAEFTREAKTSRRHLERLPEVRFDWRPHPKSFTAGQLASHIVDCIRWTSPIFSADELDLDAKPYKPFAASSLSGLLDGFDTEVDASTLAMVTTGDKNASMPWRLKMRGKIWFEKPREAVFRDMTLSHLVHHRGQFSVYLRLLDVAVPGSYGPTADGD